MTHKELRQVVATNIKARRKEIGLTQVALADACECSSVHISLIESGKTEPSFALLAKLAEALHTTPQGLLSPEIFAASA